MLASIGRFAVAVGAIQILFCVHAASARAQSLQTAPMIFDTRKSLPLQPDEPVTHDFYINAGTEAGFRKGMYVTVMRLVPVHDPVQNKQQGILTIGVARLKVVQVERSITVARLVDEYTDDERPTLEYEAVMIGDKVDPNSMTMEAPNLKKKPATRKIVKAEAQEEAPVPPPAPAPKVSAPPQPAVAVVSEPTSVAAAAQAAPPSNAPATAPSAPEVSRVRVPPPPSSRSEPQKNEPARRPTSRAQLAPPVVAIQQTQVIEARQEPLIEAPADAPEENNQEIARSTASVVVTEEAPEVVESTPEVVSASEATETRPSLFPASRPSKAVSAQFGAEYMPIRRVKSSADLTSDQAAEENASPETSSPDIVRVPVTGGLEPKL